MKAVAESDDEDDEESEKLIRSLTDKIEEAKGSQVTLLMKQLMPLLHMKRKNAFHCESTKVTWLRVIVECTLAPLTRDTRFS